MPRFLWIIRHGKAHRESPTGLDADRTLQERGERQAAYLADVIAASAHRPAQVLSSPFARAHATAEPIARALNLSLAFAAELQAERPLQPVVNLIVRHEARSLAIVGHNYQLSDLISLLTQGAGRRELELRTGQAALVRFERDVAPGAAELVGLFREPDEDD